MPESVGVYLGLSTSLAFNDNLLDNEMLLSCRIQNHWTFRLGGFVV